MSYQYLILKDHPRFFFPLGTGTNAYANSMGGAAAEVIGAPTASSPLTVGGGNSLTFTALNHMRFANDIFPATSVAKSFTLEAWFKPVDVNAPVSILGHRDSVDGIKFDGEKITFGTTHGGADNAIAEYYPENVNQSFHVVGVHTSGRNELLVNGVNVAGVDISEEQRLFGYSNGADPTFLYSGHGTTNTGSVQVDSVAVYSVALPSRQARLHFLWGREARDYRSVVTSRGGNYWTLTDDTVDVGYLVRFDSSDDWHSGLAAQVRVADDGIRPLLNDTGVTLESTWENGMILPGFPGLVDGSRINWVSDGNLTVETSINDGTTWTAVGNNREVPGISTGFDPVDKTLLIRVRFPAGESNSISRLRNLSVTLYNSRSAFSPKNAMLFDPSGETVFAEQIHQPIEYNDYAGAYVASTVNVTNPEADIVRTVEMWVKASVAGTTLTDATGTRYVNAVSGAALPVNQWAHVVYVLPADDTDGFTIGNNSSAIQVGMLATYPSALSAAEITSLYNSHIGAPSLSIVDDQKVRLADSNAQTVKIYSYDWSVVGSG